MGGWGQYPEGHQKFEEHSGLDGDVINNDDDKYNKNKGNKKCLPSVIPSTENCLSSSTIDIENKCTWKFLLSIISFFAFVALIYVMIVFSVRTGR